MFRFPSRILASARAAGIAGYAYATPGCFRARLICSWWCLARSAMLDVENSELGTQVRDVTRKRRTDR